MPQVLSHRPHLPHLSRPAARPAQDVLLTVATVALAVVALVIALVGQYDAGAVVALAGVVVGGVSMLLSATTTERFEIVTATVVAAVTLAVCLANGSGVFT